MSQTILKGKSIQNNQNYWDNVQVYKFLKAFVEIKWLNFRLHIRINNIFEMINFALFPEVSHTYRPTKRAPLPRH